MDKSWIKATQDSLGPLISKPQLKDKLLERPPFRFLHDIVNSVINETGFLRGVFSDHDLDNSNLTSKESRITFLTTLIHAVSSTAGFPIDCDPINIITGKECQQTNNLLQHIASCINQLSTTFNNEPKHSQSLSTQLDEHSVKREGNTKVTELYFGIYKVNNPQITLPKYIIPNEDWCNTTVSMLSSLIEKPAIINKYIEKPPFRYLTDIVYSIETKTGLFKNYFSEEERNRDNYKSGSGNNKVIWMTKLIQYVQVGSGDDQLALIVDPRDIVAGKRPENTSLLLQRLAILAGSGVKDEDIITVMNNGQLTYPSPPNSIVKTPYEHLDWVVGTKETKLITMERKTQSLETLDKHNNESTIVGKLVQHIEKTIGTSNINEMSLERNTNYTRKTINMEQSLQKITQDINYVMRHLKTLDLKNHEDMCEYRQVETDSHKNNRKNDEKMILYLNKEIKKVDKSCTNVYKMIEKAKNTIKTNQSKIDVLKNTGNDKIK